MAEQHHDIVRRPVKTFSLFSPIMTMPADSPDPSHAKDPLSRQLALDVPRPPSVGGISSRMTDFASEDEDQSRPRTGISSQPTWSQPPASRRGPPPARSSMAASSQGTSRPPSSGSRMSRSHVPSLAAQAFFRPMSSQRLQAHRGGRPATKGAPTATEDAGDEITQHRRSLMSNSTVRQGAVPHGDVEIPPSRDTEFTDPIVPDRGTSTASPTGNTTVRSLGESVRLLHDRDRSQRRAPTHLDLGNNYRSGDAQDPPQRSPLSFRSDILSLTNKNEGEEHRDDRGHERLSSAASSPRSVEMKGAQSAPKRDLGKNYEYFSGNTVFWGSGRFQNSRDKPINIATAIFVALPAGLFLGYSYVIL